MRRSFPQALSRFPRPVHGIRQHKIPLPEMGDGGGAVPGCLPQVGEILNVVADQFHDRERRDSPRGGSELNPLEAWILVSLSWRLAEENIRDDSELLKIVSRRVA